MAGPFDDIVGSNDPFDDIVSGPGFGNVQGGASSSPSFGNVQSGAASENQQQPWYQQAWDAVSDDNLKQIPGAAYTGLQKGSEELGKYAGLALGGVAGLFDDIVGTDLQSKVFENVVDPYSKAAEQHGQELVGKGTLAQVAGGVTNAAPDVLVGMLSMGETAVAQATTSIYKAVADVLSTGAKMAAPLAEKAAGDAYGQAIADGKSPISATTDALHAIASTEVMGVLGGAAEGKLLSRVVQSGAAAAGTGEAIRELEGREFNPVELGTNLAIGGAFGVAGHEGAPREAPRGRPEAPVEDAFGAGIRDSETANISPEGIRPQPEENVGVENPDISPPAKTESKMLPPESPQAARDAEAAAAQQEAWGPFSDIVQPELAEKVASLKERAANLPKDFNDLMKEDNSHELFSDLVPAPVKEARAEGWDKVEGGGEAKPAEIGSWQYDLDTGRTERQYTPEDTRRAAERTSTPEPVIKDYHEGTLTSGKLLDHLAADDSGRVEPETKTLAGYLKAASKRFGGDSVKITRYNENDPLHADEKVPANEVQGYYHPVSNAIRITRDAPTQHVLLHETVHALTNRAVIRGVRNELGGQAQHAYNALNGVFEGVKNHLDFVSKAHNIDQMEAALREGGASRKDIYDQIPWPQGNEKANRGHYGFTNLDEFLAEFFSNAKFRDILKGVKLDKISAKTAGVTGRLAFGKIRNVYEATVSGIRKMLGLPEKAETALDATFAAAHQFLGNLQPEHLGNVDKYAHAPEMSGPVDRETIDRQAQAAIRAGANPDMVAQRVQQLYKEHGHSPAPTSTKNAVMEAERAAEGRDPIIKQAAQSNPETLNKAQLAITKNPSRPQEVISKLNEDGVHSISAEDEAVLLLEKARLRNARDEAADTVSDPKASEEAKATAQVAFTEHEAAINLLDQATEASGREWGRLGQFRQQFIKSDYSLAGLERKARAAKGAPLTKEEAAQVREDHARVQDAQKELDRTQNELSDKTEVKASYQQLVKEMTDQLASAKKSGKFMEALKKNADESKEWLKKRLGQLNAGIDPEMFFHMARIGAYHIAKGAVDLKDWLLRMKKELGPAYAKVEGSLPSVYEAAKAQHDAGATQSKPRMRAKQDIDPENITHKDVWDLARAHINRGVHGEDAVMKAVHGDLKQYGLSERDVRRLFSEYGRVKFPSKEADKTELREIRSLVQMQESIDRLQEGKDALKSGTQRDKASQVVREKRRQLNDLLKVQEQKNGLSPEKLATYQDARARNLKNQIEDLQKEIATGEKKERRQAPDDNAEITALKAERDSLKDELKKIETPEAADKRYQAARNKSMKNQMQELYTRIEKGDYAKRERPDRDLNKANQEAAYRLYQAKNLFNRHAFEMQMAARPPLKKLAGNIREYLNLSRAIMTSWDLSATLRQGGFIAVGHPIQAAKTLATAIKAMRSEKAQYAVQKEIETRPNFQLYRKAGLDLTLGSGHELGKQEEQFMSRLVEKEDMKHNQPVRNTLRKGKNLLLAPTRASERAFKTFINKLRADSFDNMYSAFVKDGSKPTKQELQAIASYINVATGRGKLGKDNRYAGKLLSDAFFAPRLVASRFNLLAGQPMYGGSTRTRTMIAKEYARFLGGLATVYALGAVAHMASDHKDDKFLEMDPRSSNFGKMKFGNTFIDPMTGLGQVTTFLGREISGQNKTQKGEIVSLYKPGYGQSGRVDVLTRFLRTKLAPIPGALLNIGEGKNVIGQEVTPEGELLNLTTPMSLSNVKAIMEEHGIPAGAAIEMLDLLGMSVQQRTPYKKQPKTSQESK